jgi:LysM repeat protein
VTTLAPDAPLTIMVQPGDTLVSLAKRHRTTVTALRAVNALSGDQLVVGTKLILP